jgi:hypothetical protein
MVFFELNIISDPRKVKKIKTVLGIILFVKALLRLKIEFNINYSFRKEFEFK